MNVAIPLVLLMGLAIDYTLIFWRSRIYHYIHSPLEAKVNRLFGAALEQWVLKLAKAPAESGQRSGNSPCTPLAKSEFLRQNIWAWHCWTRSDRFQRFHKPALTFQVLLLTAVVLSVLLFCIAVGYWRVLSEDYRYWSGLGMESLLHPIRISMLILPVAFLGASLAVAYRLLRDVGPSPPVE